MLSGQGRINYVVELGQLAAPCRFGFLHEEMIRDQLIEKTTSSKLREQLLLEPDTLTLLRDVDLGNQMEIAVKEAISMLCVMNGNEASVKYKN